MVTAGTRTRLAPKLSYLVLIWPAAPSEGGLGVFIHFPPKEGANLSKCAWLGKGLGGFTWNPGWAGAVAGPGPQEAGTVRKASLSLTQAVPLTLAHFPGLLGRARAGREAQALGGGGRRGYMGDVPGL